MRYGGGGSDFAKLLDDQKKVTGKRQRHTKPLFHQAAYGGHLTIAKILLDRAKTDGQDVKKMVDAQDAKGFTPLHYAALGGRDAMIEYLLSQGADIDARTNKQQGRFSLRPFSFFSPPPPSPSKLTISRKENGLVDCRSRAPYQDNGDTIGAWRADGSPSSTR